MLDLRCQSSLQCSILGAVFLSASHLSCKIKVAGCNSGMRRRNETTDASRNGCIAPTTSFESLHHILHGGRAWSAERIANRTQPCTSDLISTLMRPSLSVATGKQNSCNSKTHVEDSHMVAVGPLWGRQCKLTHRQCKHARGPHPLF